MLFCTFLSRPCTTTPWNDQILSLLQNGNSKTINSTISLWTRPRFLLFRSNQNSPLLSNKANWDNREKVYKNTKSIFQRCFHLRRRCRIVKVPLANTWRRRLRKRHLKCEFALCIKIILHWPEIWKETHLREIFHGTSIFQQSSMICISHHVGGHTLDLQHSGQTFCLCLVKRLLVTFRCAVNVTTSSFSTFSLKCKCNILFSARGNS